MAQKVDRQELQIRFLQAINGADYRFIEGLNPFHILLNGTEYWIYIKNLTSAHFTNPDVWRAQLPLRDDFNVIKESDAEFIMLGYDDKNDVYATWNPVWVKQRLNSTENVSLYSRYPLQVESRQSFQLKRLDLGNDGEVVIFPREMTRMFFINVGSYFLNTGDYVAMGSKRRPEANEAFKRFSNVANVAPFAKYLTDEGLSSVNIGSYCRVIRALISEGFITRNRKIFLQYDSLADYEKAIPQFIDIPEVRAKNDKWHNLISAALGSYIAFLNHGVQPEEEDATIELPVEEESIPSPSEVVDRPNQATPFDHFCNLETVERFERALFHKDYLRSTVKRYSRAMRYLIKEGFLEQHKNVFLTCASYSQYQNAADQFFRIPDVRAINEERHHDYSAAMKQYVEFLVRTETYVQPVEPEHLLKEGETAPYSTTPSPVEEERDWEAEFTDENGKLTRIANPALLEKLRPVLDREYPNAATACNIVEDFYGDRFRDMEFYEWGRLFKQIDWSNPVPRTSSVTEPETPTRRSKSVILRVELANGTVIEHKNVSTTYCEAIKSIGPEEVSILGIYHAGVNIVSRELDAKYADYQRPIGDGWYVMTNSQTPVKYQDLLRIIEEYGIDMKVSMVALDPTATLSVVPSESKTGTREKIKVRFPDGRIIQPSKVLEALVEVVKFAGAERVRALNIICCGDNLILKHPTPRYENPCKPVGDGWLCNTCSGTPTKFEQIKEISNRLGLGLIVEMV